MVAAGRRNLRQSQYGDGKFYVPGNISEKIDEWLDGKFFLYNNEYGTKWQQIFNDMNLLLKAGVKVFALDNLMSLDIDLLEGDKNGKQRELMLQIKEFAKKNKVLKKDIAENLWIDEKAKILAFVRGDLLYAFNFHPTESATNFFLHAHKTGEGEYKAIFSTDEANFGGQDRIDKKYVYLPFPTSAAWALKFISPVARR